MSDLVVGLFVLAAIAISVSLVMLKGSTGSKPVECVGYFDDIALLEKGAKVAVNGLQVGKVTKIGTESFPVEGGESKIMIEVKFTVAESVFEDLRGGTVAVIEQESFLGGKFIKINPVTSGDPFEQKDGEYLFANTQSYADPFAVLKQLGGKAGPLVDELKEMIGQAKDILASVQRADLEKILNDADKLLVDADGLVLKTGDTIDEVKEASSERAGRFPASTSSSTTPTPWCSPPRMTSAT